MAKDFMVKESELDDIQQRVLDQTLDKSCIVTGCAGSGKSVIALQKAKRIQNEKGNDYKIIVYTKALCDFMNGGRNQLGLSQRFYYHEEWKWKRVLKRYGNKGSFWVYEKDVNGNKILDRAKADYIIVDEIQDFTKEEIQEFIDAAKKHFFFFGDTGQSIYDGIPMSNGQIKKTLPVEDIRSMSPSSKEFPLYYNYRLPKPIARVTQDYVGVDVDQYGDGSVYKSQETKMPCFIGFNSLAEQISAIARIISRDSLTDVGILVPSNDIIPEISKLLNNESINHEIRYNDKEDFKQSKDTLDFTTTNPKLMTYHSSKGLQFETVFMPGVLDIPDLRPNATESEKERWKSDRKAIYVAMTRTYRDLYIMYSNKLPKPLSNVPKELYQTTEVETIEDI